jgi:hypothetical protein
LLEIQRLKHYRPDQTAVINHDSAFAAVYRVQLPCGTAEFTVPPGGTFKIFECEDFTLEADLLEMGIRGKLSK